MVPKVLLVSMALTVTAVLLGQRVRRDRQARRALSGLKGLSAPKDRPDPRAQMGRLGPRVCPDHPVCLERRARREMWE